MASVFTKIIDGELPGHRVYEDDAHIALLDIRPIAVGHTLVIPKREVSYLFDMAAEEQDALWAVVRTVEAKLRRAFAAERVVMMVVGYEVPHVHIHLIPTKRLADFPPPPGLADAPPAEEVLARIEAAGSA